MNVVHLISKKRDGNELSSDEIGALIRGYAAGDVPDYQMSAWAMAVYLRGMTVAETTALTEHMLRSGETFRPLLEPFTGNVSAMRVTTISCLLTTI